MMAGAGQGNPGFGETVGLCKGKWGLDGKSRDYIEK
jgi:hypothetical protein